MVIQYFIHRLQRRLESALTLQPVRSKRTGGVGECKGSRSKMVQVVEF